MTTKTVTLAAPIAVNGTPTNVLTFSKAKLKDLIAGEIGAKIGGEMGRMGAILASMAGVPYPALQDIDVDDFNKVLLEVADLLGNFPAPAPTGAPQPA